eukprot:m.2616 g.2616  ORF g.2616 m.2616 type:complete len:936 (+) comp8796_c0_seq1:1336-4143(+)
MKLFLSVALALAVILGRLQGARSLTLVNNGYKELIVAISDLMPEDPTLIDAIKRGFTLSSQYLYRATKYRAYFDTITIVVPQTWSKRSNYQISSKESYNTAHVRIDPTGSDGYNRDVPYTRRPTICGKQAGYMRLTSDFITQKIKNYGESRRTIVHEFGHLRWGLMDEYPYPGQPEVYPDGKGKSVIATGCSVAYARTTKVHVRNSMEPCTRKNMKECVADRGSATSGTASIMNYQHKKEVVEFCDSGSNPDTQHNRKAPNNQNQECHSHSSWYYMERHEDFAGNNNPPGTNFRSTTPTFTVVQTTPGPVVLLLDNSLSMLDDNKLPLLRQAAKSFIQAVSSGVSLSIVTFGLTATIQVKGLSINSRANRTYLISKLPSSTIGGTSIGAGLISSLDIITEGRDPNSPAPGTIILVTDGEEFNAPFVNQTLGRLLSTKVTLNTIGIGASASRLLFQLSKDSGGTFYFSPSIPNSLQTTSSLRESLLTVANSINPLSNHTTTMEKAVLIYSLQARIEEGESESGVFTVDPDANRDTAMVFDWLLKVYDYIPQVTLTSPSGKIFKNKDFNYTQNFLNLQLTSEGSRENGDWKYTVRNPNVLGSWSRTQLVTTTVTSKPSIAEPLLLTAHVVDQNVTYPTIITIVADLVRGNRTVVGARVTAKVIRPGGTSVFVDLKDDGNSPDSAEKDGFYAGRFTNYKGNGRYSVIVQASADAYEAKSIVYIHPFAIDVNATLMSDSQLPAPVSLPKFMRTTSAGAFELNNYTSVDLIPPASITDLTVVGVTRKGNNAEVTLKWTAAGDDDIEGNATSYSIAYAGTFDDVLDYSTEVTYVKKPDVLSGSLDPLPGGSLQSITIVVQPTYQQELNDDLYFFGINSTDDAGLTSELSNIVQVEIPHIEATTTIPTMAGAGTATAGASTTSAQHMTLLVFVMIVFSAVFG